MAESAPSTPEARPNAAIFFADDAFDTNRPGLMGRHVAGDGFLRGFVRHGGTDRLYCYCRYRDEAQDFANRVRDHGSAVPVVWVRADAPQEMAQVGCLFYPALEIDRLAWHRRRLDQRAYSLVGITHTTAVAATMRAIANLLIDPVQAWDAVICTSRAVHDMLVTVLEAQSAYLAARLGATRPTLPELPIIPLGVDCDAFAPVRVLREVWRERLGIGPQDVAVLYFGRLNPLAKAHPLPMYRGLEQALDAASLPRHARLHLIQAGWFNTEPTERAFRDGAAAHCPRVICHFLDGRQLDVRKGIWHAADIYTSLSDNIQETFGLSPIEAMAAGLPVVVSDWDGYRDTVQDGISGFRVPTLTPPAPFGTDLAARYELEIDAYDDYIGFASQLTAVDTGAAAASYAALIGNPELRRRMGKAGAAEARARLDWPVVIAQIQELWAELADRRRIAPEIAPLPDREPNTVAAAHPARADPFFAFAGYPTEVLRPDSVVSLVPGATPEEAVARRNSPPANLLKPAILPDIAELTGVVRRLAAEGPMTALALADAVAPGQTSRIYRGLVWMAKMDLVRIVRPAAAATGRSLGGPGGEVGDAPGIRRPGRPGGTRRRRN